jgi:hypothetical protein
VAQKKMDELQKNIKVWEKNNKLTDEKLTKILESFNELNNNLKSKKSEDDVYQFFDPKNINLQSLEYLSKYDNDPMINQLKLTTQKYPCLVTNFDYIDGWPYSDTEWTLNFKVKKPITIKYNNGSPLNLSIGNEIWLYWPEGNFRVGDKEFNLFEC